MKEMERALSTSVVRRPRLLPGVRESSNRAHSVPKFAKILKEPVIVWEDLETLKEILKEPVIVWEDLETQILKEPVIVWEDLETPKELLLEKTPPLLDI